MIRQSTIIVSIVCMIRLVALVSIGVPLSATRAQSSGWKRSTSAPPRRSAGDEWPVCGIALSREMLKEVFLLGVGVGVGVGVRG